MARLVALLSCTKSKTPYPAPAPELYSASALFRKALAYVTPYADDVYVLSAKYGLVSLDQRLEPYEQTLKEMPGSVRREWAQRVFDQIQARYGTDLANNARRGPQTVPTGRGAIGGGAGARLHRRHHHRRARMRAGSVTTAQTSRRPHPQRFPQCGRGAESATPAGRAAARSGPAAGRPRAAGATGER